MTSLAAFDPLPPAGDIGEEPRGGAATASSPNPLLIIHRGLRGRYPVAIGLGLLLGLCFGVVGFKTVKPIYSSTALVRVAPTQARIIYQTEDNATMANWDSFVLAQASFLQSRRVVQLALGNERLATAGWDRGPLGEVQLASGLEVLRARGAEIISVTFKHTDPVKAQAAVNSIVDAYNQLKDETFGLESGVKERAIDDRVRQLQSRLDGLRQEEQQLLARYSVADIEMEHKAKTDLLGQLDKARFEVRQRIVIAESLRGPDKPEDAVEPRVSDEQLSRQSKEFAALLATKALLEREIAARFNLTPAHREIVSLNERLASTNNQIDAIRESLLAQPQELAIEPIDARDQLVSLPQLKQQLDAIEEEYAALRDDVRSIGDVRRQLDSIRETKTDVKQQLDVATKRQTELEVERNNAKTGRISIMQFGDAPLSPTTDRRIPIASAGLVGGMGLGVGVLWLLGFARGGYRFADDVEDPALSAPLLEVLPFVDDTNPEWLDLAAHSVHHVRGILNNARKGDDAPLVILLSSATAGEGKSYVANAVAHSFAISGHKTVLLDADLLGCQLSTRLGLGERRGLRDAAAEGLLPEAIAVGDRLSVVPVGLRDDFQPEQLNRQYLLSLVEKLRTQFDTVIIDSGPILGSLEASLLTQIADRTLLVVARGQRPGMVKAAVARVRQLGGVLAGFVFNRAVRGDYLASSYSASVSRHSLSERTSRPRPRPANAPVSPLLLSMRSSLSGNPGEGTETSGQNAAGTNALPPS